MAARTYYVVVLSWHDDSEEGTQERREAFTSKYKAVKHFHQVVRESDHEDVVRLVRYQLLDLPPKEVFRRLLEERHFAKEIEELRKETIPYRGPPKPLVAEVVMELDLLPTDASNRDRWDTVADIAQEHLGVDALQGDVYDLVVELLDCHGLKKIAMDRDEFLGIEPTGTAP